MKFADFFKYYKVQGVDENRNIHVIEVPELPDDFKLESYPMTYHDRNVGLFYWDIVPSNAEVGPYCQVCFFPAFGHSGEDLYFAYQPLEYLGSDNPLDRFIWEDEQEPDSVEALHRIILEKT